MMECWTEGGGEMVECWTEGGGEREGSRRYSPSCLCELGTVLT